MTSLTTDQERYLQRARQVLADADTAGPDVHSLAHAVGSLQWHLTEMIKLVEHLTNA
jgi:type II secretory pathway component PulM